MNRALLPLAFLIATESPAAAEPKGQSFTCTAEPLDAGTRWLHRELGVSYKIPDKTVSLKTETLVIGPKGTVQLVRHELEAPRDAGKPMPDPNTFAWSCKKTTVLRGSVTKAKKGFELSLTGTDQSDEQRLSCRVETARVASAAAVCVRGRSTDESCTAWTWSPAATQTTKVLRCSSDADDSVVFGAAPGIELAFGEQDCDERSALRQVANDGRLRHVQKPSSQP